MPATQRSGEKKLEQNRKRYAENKEFREKQKAATDRRCKADPDHKEKHNEKSREYYARDREDVCSRRVVHRKRNKRMCVKYLGGKCMSCGESTIEVLQFHHREPSSKEYEVSTKMTAANLKDK